MSAEEQNVKLAKRTAKYIVGTLAAATAIYSAYRSFQIVPAQSYGVDIKFGQLKSDHLPPGVYWKVPFFEEVHVLNNNTIILETDEIGSSRNSSDQNSITGNFRLHVKINPQVGSIALNVDKVTGGNAESTLQLLETQALNASVGSRPATDTLADTEGFLKAFKANLEWRIAQNNLPIEVDSIELLELHVSGSSASTSESSNDNGMRKVVQLRIKSDGTVEAMAGPAAVPVNAGGLSVGTPPTSVRGFSGPPASPSQPSTGPAAPKPSP